MFETMVVDRASMLWALRELSCDGRIHARSSMEAFTDELCRIRIRMRLVSGGEAC